MQENFAVISGSIEKDVDVRYIANIAKDRYANYTTAHHEWINKVEAGDYRTALDKVRTDPTILNTIHKQFPHATIKPATEADEVYWAVSPKGATGSDRSLVDCHYDSPLAWIPTGGVIFYRVIIACNENNTVTTTFPNEDKRVKMNTKDFHGLDYNADLHCVEGAIPKDKYRVLLKMHYIIVPPDAQGYESFVKSMNVGWTVLSRETMRMSANPTNWYEYLVALIVNVCRVVFNNYDKALILVVALCCMYIFIKSSAVKKFLK